MYPASQTIRDPPPKKFIYANTDPKPICLNDAVQSGACDRPASAHGYRTLVAFHNWRLDRAQTRPSRKALRMSAFKNGELLLLTRCRRLRFSKAAFICRWVVFRHRRHQPAILLASLRLAILATPAHRLVTRAEALAMHEKNVIPLLREGN